jgi:dephospho-CoA kinase
MLRVGLTGGLASGKSFVGRLLQEMGCYVIHADILGRELLQPGQAVAQLVIHEFGPEIVDSAGAIDRRKLGRIVFHEAGHLARLNALVHPAVRARSQELLEDFARREPHGIAVYEAAILIETGSYRDFAKLVLAVCRAEQQVERAMARDGSTREEALERIGRQMPLEEKVKYADYIIDTSGSKEETALKVRGLYQSLMQDNALL